MSRAARALDDRIAPPGCELEPIHIPGSVQPHGVLLALSEPALQIISASANAERLLGVAARDLTGRPLAAVLAADSERMVRDYLAGGEPAGLESLDLQAGTDACRGHWVAQAHRRDGLTLLELEPPAPPVPGGSALLLVSAAASRLHAAPTQAQACAVAAAEVRHLTGFDRVNVYRFAADWSGEVLGEARDPEVAAYLGLRFPADDIPAQARELYRLNPLRLIVDTDYQPSPLIPDRNPATGGPIDLSFAALRSVSPVHLEYMRNMRVRASMSMSIMRGEALWGLIACHHRTPRHVAAETRQACALIASMLASQLEAQERVERARNAGRLAAMRASLLDATVSGSTATEAVEGKGRAMLELAEASGFALLLPDRIVRTGALPDDAMLADLRDVIDAQVVQDAPFATDRLGEIYPPARRHADTISGLLAVPLSRSRGSYLLWCRPEQPHSVTWAGEPVKPVADTPGIDGRGIARLQPRKSFEVWTERVRGQSAPWTPRDIAAAEQLRHIVLDLMAREKDDLERQNLRLVHSTRELETFIYIASHDIKEPLRQMEVLASLLRPCIAAEAAEEADELLGEFAALALRLRTLTDELGAYARLGRSAEDFQPVPLGEVIDDVLAQLRGSIEQTAARIRVGALPVAWGERRQLHQLFLNLLGNSLKYRAADRAPEIAIDAQIAEADGLPAEPGHRPMARIAVADNGIGFDASFDEHVFEPFWRLYPRDRYEGSGLGLAICRRIVERHGGHIRAHGEAGRGCTFRLTLPIHFPG
jgi:light-regulated signal transduction histidine kinase (bacteriophytochrome)